MPSKKTERFNATSDEQLRTVDFRPYQDELLYNQYDIQVFDNTLTPVDVASSGRVSVEIELEGSSKRRAGASDVDLTSDNWSFDPFILAVEKAIFTATSLPVGYEIQVSCKRGDS